MTTLHCTACDTALVPHCGSPTCHWLKCDGACEWRVYDVEHGTRVSVDGQVERITEDEQG